ncbi:hypothetical protein MMC28_000568 [Mycoblastus sanguinarius]|nr:hypothetical protein [Mycoblastus sanguinarius]
MTMSMTIPKVTVTVSVVPNGSKGFSLAFPSMSPAASASTTYVLDWASSPTNAVASTSQPPKMTTTSATDTSSIPASTTSSSTPKSPLCFNTALQTPLPCPSTTTTTTSPSSSKKPPSPPPSASQASTLNPLSLASTALTILTFIYTIHIILQAIFHNLLTRASAAATKDSGTQTTDLPHLLSKDRDIHVVEGSGRQLSAISTLEREITVIPSTARLYKTPLLVDKVDIHVVEGSARPLEMEEGTA